MKKNYIITVISVLLTAALLAGCASAAASAENASGKDASGKGSADASELVSDIATTQSFSDEAVPDKDIEQILLAGVNAPSAMNSQPWHFTAVTDKATLEKIAGGAGGGMPFGAKPPDNNGAAPRQGDVPAPDAGGKDFKAPGNPPEGFKPPKDGEKPDRVKPGAQNGAPEGFSPSAGGPEGMPLSPGSKAGVADAPLAIVISCVEGSEFDAGLACQNMSVEAQLLGYGTKIVSSPTMVLNGADKETYKELLGIPDNQSAVAVLLVGRVSDSGDSADAVTGATERNPLTDIVTYINGKN